MEKYKLFYIFVVTTVYSCQPEKKQDIPHRHSKEAVLHFLDSVVVNSLTELYISDKDPHTNRIMLNDWAMNELFITNLKGEILSRFEPRGEGPHQVPSPLEMAFWKDGFLIKEMSPGQHFHFFNGSFEKTAKGPALADGISVIGMPNSGKSFSLVESNGESLILGYEYNAIDTRLWAKEEQHADFYKKAEMG